MRLLKQFQKINQNKKSKSILLCLSFSLLGINFFYLLNGFYIIGDTVSYLQHAFEGGLLTTFIKHVYTWPPATAIIFNILRMFTNSVIVQHQLYLLIVNALLIVVLVNFLKLAGVDSKMALFAAIGGLFLGIQSLLFKSALSEPLFLLFWLSSMLFLCSFVKSKRSVYLLFYIVTASLLPLTRYAGVPLLVLFSALLFIYMSLAKKTKYLPFYVLCAVLLSWMPIAFYLFKNKLTVGTLFGPRDLQLVGVTYGKLIASRIKTLMADLPVPALSFLLLGNFVRWRKRFKLPVCVLSLSLITYYVFLIISQKRYYFFDNFPSRYLSITYPAILVVIMFIGSRVFNSQKSIKARILLTTFLIGLAIVNQINSDLDRFKREIQKPGSVVYGAEYSKDIENFCKNSSDKNKYLLIDPLDRNWVAQSLRYYCGPIDVIEARGEVSLSKDYLLFSPIDLSTPGLNKQEIYEGQKRVYVYNVDENLKINFEKELGRI